MDPSAAALLLQAGGDPSGFQARQLTEAHVALADLTLTATREQRGRVARLHPPSMRTMFAAGDFAQLMTSSQLPNTAEGGKDASRVGVIAELAARRRGLVPTPPAGQVDVPDPYRRDQRAFREMAHRLTAVADAVAACFTEPGDSI